LCRRGEPLVLGVDLDNTIADYGPLMHEIALDRGLVDSDCPQTKAAVRDTVRRLANGELQWRRVQAAAYGTRMREATLMHGVADLLRTCKRRGIPVYIVSHKTEYSNLGESDVNLRAAALTWLESQSFFHADGFALAHGNVSFHDSRAEKIERIRTLKITHFIDDLEELFQEPLFPPDVIRILFTPQGRSSHSPAIHSFASWEEIADFLFSGRTLCEAVAYHG